MRFGTEVVDSDRYVIYRSLGVLYTALTKKAFNSVMPQCITQESTKRIILDIRCTVGAPIEMLVYTYTCS